jgi:hypothetical protein
MLGLENPAHTASAQLIENAILSELKACCSADQDSLGLKPGEKAEIHQGPCDHPTPLALRQLRVNRNELGIRQEPTLAHVCQKSFTANVLAGIRVG